MNQSNLMEMFGAGKVVLGICNMYPAAGIIEGMGKGWDLVWIDGQHGQFSYDTTLASVRTAAAVGLETLVRVPTHDQGLLGLYADMQPSAIMVPLVDTPQQAQAIVDGLCFPPKGNRSYGGRRPIDLYGREYYHQRCPVVVAQIESLEAAQNAGDIIGTDGIDMIFFGPDDMKLRMGLPISTSPTEHPQLREAMANTAEAARAAGKFAGTVAATPEAVKICADMGYQLLMGGSDIGFLRTAAPEQLARLRTAIGEKATQPTDPGKQTGLYGE